MTNWVTFEVAGGGLVAVQLQHIVAIYDEQSAVKLATTASGVHILKDTSVKRALMVVSSSAYAEAARNKQIASMRAFSHQDGQIAYDIEDFCKD